MAEDQPDLDDIAREIDEVLKDITGETSSDAVSKADSESREGSRFASQSTSEQLLEVLQEDARASYKNLANRAGVSKPTVRKYIKELEEEGIIMGYSVDLNPQNLRDTTIAIVRIEIEEEHFEETSDTVASMDEVYSLFTIRDMSGVLAEIRATDFMALSKVVSDEISTLAGVESTSMNILEEKHQ